MKKGLIFGIAAAVAAAGAAVFFFKKKKNKADEEYDAELEKDFDELVDDEDDDLDIAEATIQTDAETAE